jgi:hypothetical protein
MVRLNGHQHALAMHEAAQAVALEHVAWFRRAHPRMAPARAVECLPWWYREQRTETWDDAAAAFAAAWLAGCSR